MFFNLGGPRLWDRDEPRNAACASEMLERGDWVVPTFNGELRVLKPIMKYWLMIVAYKIFGVNEFAARFWSAVFALATVVATYFVGKRLYNASAGLWAALVLATSLLFVTAGHLAKIDAGLTFFSTMALLIYVYSTFERRDANGAPDSDFTPSTFVNAFPQSWLMAVLMYAAIGLAALAKGLPGLLVPAGVIGMFLLIARLPKTTEVGGRPWWRRTIGLLRPFAPMHFLRTFWSMRPLTAVVVTLAVAGPWYVLVGIQTDGEFLRGFFLEHHLGRAMQPMENHSGPFLLYYIGAILAGFFPWSVFVPAVLSLLVAQFRRGHSWRDANLFAVCWIGVYVVIFSLARTKLPSYITPCFPALALLMGSYLHQLSAGVEIKPLWIRFGIVLQGVIGFGIAAGLVFVARAWVPGEELLGLIGLILALGAITAFVLLPRRPSLASATLAFSAIAFCATLFGVGLVRVGGKDDTRAVCAAICARTAEPTIGSFGAIDPSWVFYSHHPIQPVLLTETTADQPTPWKVTPILAADFYDQGLDRFIITTDENWDALRVILPADAQVIAESPRFFHKGRWLVIGHRGSGLAKLTQSHDESNAHPSGAYP